MNGIKLIIPGDCVIKKNNYGELWFRYDKRGNKIPLPSPIHYWTTPYQEWARKAIQSIIVWKTKNPDFKLLTGQYVMSCIFFMSKNYTVNESKAKLDITNMLEGPQDVLAGNAGNFLDTTRTVGGIKTKIKYDHSKYQILADDNCRIVKNLGASTVFYSPHNPHTEIFISEFKPTLLGDLMRLCHPGLELGDTPTDTPSLFNNKELFGDVL